ncbi:hypothetical protein TSOC_008258 [Tetrabaena socialis]|uniref:DUF4455 domain-containing protein n=1 Tax=Tetrabaena socialis TaxID=47790 RepID=A0A2J7ZYV4_9CHLO|nr:hypothetical protein TSOC_008258 [Tetrabaena socialis]|eukprot:PNH05442.1 hypothetical protein TSOC_008258 [Tetrabaena socialis]
MDWEKKTVARPPLREAAADVFNDSKTPGQALLTALQAAETVWDCVAQRIPLRARWVEECGAALETAEERRREAVEAALVEVVAALNDAAVVSEGEVERMVEKEAMALNVAILENRGFHRDMTALARAYPAAVRTANDTYHLGLCGELGVQPQAPPPPPPAADAEVAAAAAEGAAAAAEAVEAVATPRKAEVIGHVKLLDGRSFSVITDVLRTVLLPAPPPPPPPPPAAPPPPPSVDTRATTPAVSSRASTPTGAKARAAAAAAAATAAEAEAAAAAAAEAAAAEAEAARVAAEAAVAAALAAIATSPLASNGTPLCRTLALPEDVLGRTVEQLQAGLLSDMMTFCQKTMEAADSWAAEREVALTQELDSWLRHHSTDRA